MRQARGGKFSLEAAFHFLSAPPPLLLLLAMQVQAVYTEEAAISLKMDSTQKVSRFRQSPRDPLPVSNCHPRPILLYLPFLCFTQQRLL